jgi:cob(I)alamin adenosyltransferase
MKVYTKTGDKGQTALFGGKRVSKDDIRIESYGTVDELNSNIGVLLGHIKEEDLNAFLLNIQSILFDIGSHLASDGTAEDYLPALNEEEITKLEKEMDRYSENLPVLKSFILPRGNTRIAFSHVCRTVCRRAERRVVALSEQSEIPDFIIRFLNRLSDYFFVLARYLTLLDGIDEEKWSSK